MRQAEADLGDAREARVRAEAAVGAARQTLDAVRERIAERLECAPEQTAALADLSPTEPRPDPHQIESKLEKLVRERENMGPVNLLAEAEAAELDQQIAGMQNERADSGRRHRPAAPGHLQPQQGGAGTAAGLVRHGR